jgi:basic membrane lipoprotein Med (substrate-binding protein (PBP1-ABC) superfamily)
MDGVKVTRPDAVFSVTFIGSWYDPPKAKEAAFAMIDQGADVLYAERFGVSDAAKERGVKAIGNVIDTQNDYPGTVIASALWHMEPTINQAIDLVAAGEFTAEDYGPLSNIQVGGCTVAPMDPTLVPQEVIDLVKAQQSAIMSGKLEVAINDEEPKPTR